MKRGPKERKIKKLVDNDAEVEEEEEEVKIV